MKDYEPLNGGTFINVIPINTSKKFIDIISSKVSECKFCGKKIAFIASKKNKLYPVNTYLQASGVYRISASDFHDCLTD
jgi:hypothetical protein